ncbi:MAG: methyltransferase domain-containing protein [Sphingomicrobium sp.]
MSLLFDMGLRAARRDRAARMGVETFLHERAFADCLERITLIGDPWERTLLLGCPDTAWPARLAQGSVHVTVADPGALFARAANGEMVVEDHWPLPPESFGLICAIGTLDTVNDLPLALQGLAAALAPGGLLIGAISGGNTLPLLRRAMAAADLASGAAAAHVHPRIEASALAPLLANAGLLRPVVDVDRVDVTYPSLRRLVDDLRRMGATNLLIARPRNGLGKAARAAAQAEFEAERRDGRSTETFEILHFAAWKPPR